MNRTGSKNKHVDFCVAQGLIGRHNALLNGLVQNFLACQASAIIDGFMIGVGGSVYVIPLSYVRECLELPVDALGTDDRMDIHYDLRGEFLPAVRLRKVFHPNAKRPKRENIIVVSFGGMKAGIVADQLHGESQTVIKPLGNLFEQNRAISGATIMGNGDVALIIDVPKLITEVSSISASLEQANA